MSKVIKAFKSWVFEGNNYSKLFGAHTPGQRIIPANTVTENTKHQLRIDAGEVKNGKKNIYLQANSQAKNTALKKYISKHGTHSNIGVAQINVDVAHDKQKEEADKAFKQLEAEFHSKIG
jgi:hypothetical protein